jgi:hypothetical protein
MNECVCVRMQCCDYRDEGTETVFCVTVMATVSVFLSLRLRTYSTYVLNNVHQD